MLELQQILAENRAQLVHVCFKLVVIPSSTRIRCTVQFTAKSVTYLVFADGATMETAFRNAVDNVSSGDWRVAKFQ